MKKLLIFAIITIFAIQVKAQQTINPLASEINPKGLLKVTTWNTEWLGCAENGPNNENLQMQNVAKAIKLMNSDIICLQEVIQSDAYPSINKLVSLLGGDYAGNIVPWSREDCRQNQGVIYKKSRVQFVNSLLLRDNSYSWSSGRFPAVYNFNLIENGIARPITFVNIHAKAYNDEQSYERRKGGAAGLKTILDGVSYNAKRIVLIGDFNDYLVGTQCHTKTESPYKNFIDDNENYSGLTRYFNGSIDHIVVSSELFENIIRDSVYRENGLRNAISSFRNNTSDHTPVSAVFSFGDLPTSVETKTVGRNLEIYPNPAKNEITVRGIENVKCEFEIYNMLGKQVLSGNTTDGKAINISNLPTGVYIIKMGDYLTKFIKE